MPEISNSHRARVRQELLHAGMTSLGLQKPSSRYLCRVIHDTEHIEAIAYSPLFFAAPELVATSARIVFLAHRPGMTHSEDIAYDVVAGIKSSFGVLFGSLTLHTRIHDYTLSYVHKPSALAFIDFIEGERLERLSPRARPMPNQDPARLPDFPQPALAGGQPSAQFHEYMPSTQPLLLGPEVVAFLTAHDAGVLSTVDPAGEVYGAAVYYLANEQGDIHMVTKMNTAKAQNMLTHHQVALTIYDENPARTLQLEGTAEIEQDQYTRDDMFQKMVQPRLYKSGLQLPPLASLDAGGYVVMKITPTRASYHPYQSGAEE